MLILPKIVYCIEHEHGMATLSRGCKPRTETRTKGGPAEQFLKYGRPMTTSFEVVVVRGRGKFGCSLFLAV